MEHTSSSGKIDQAGHFGSCLGLFVVVVVVVAAMTGGGGSILSPLRSYFFFFFFFAHFFCIFGAKTLLFREKIESSSQNSSDVREMSRRDIGKNLARLLIQLQQQRQNLTATGALLLRQQHYSSSSGFLRAAMMQHFSTLSSSVNSMSSSASPCVAALLTAPRNRFEYVRAHRATKELKRMAKQRYTRIGSSRTISSCTTTNNNNSNNNQSSSSSSSSTNNNTNNNNIKPVASTEDAFVNQKNRGLTLCVEGNISSGKSTFLFEVIGGESSSLKQEAFVVPEPVESWQKIPGASIEGENNVLDAFYKEPERYAYTFQNYVFITRCLQYNASKDFEAQDENSKSRFRVCERSIFSDRKVFVDSLMDAKWLTNMEFHLYNCWFDALGDESLVPDAFVYLRASPETCKRRLGFRSRGEESGVTLEYLQQLHEKHENWFREDDRTASAPKELTENVPEELKGMVKFIEITLSGKKTFPFVPVLVVDGDKDFDVALDIEKKEMYANKVRSFHRFVSEFCKR
jgi:deoxyadenosine/deoxycytidine kinase